MKSTRPSFGPTVAQQDRALARIMDGAHRRSVKKVAIGLSVAELNLIREWFNATDDAAPGYLGTADRRLMKKIMAFISEANS